jgi:hypothetical protein
MTRSRRDAARAAPVPPQQSRPIGRPRRKGRRRPTLAGTAADPATGWRPLTLATWSGRGARAGEIVTGTAVWSHAGLLPAGPRRWVLIGDPAGAFAPQALLGTEQAAAPEQILSWGVPRWQLAGPAEEVRRHLGVATQRPCSGLAIGRTPPALLGRVSLGTLLAQPHLAAGGHLRQAAWDSQPRPTCADALALVRRQLWALEAVHPAACVAAVVTGPRGIVARLTAALCAAA